MRILSVTIIPPGEDAQWWRISNIAKILRLEGCEVDIVHYIVKGYESHKKLKEMETKKYYKDSLMVLSPLSIPFKHFKKISKQNYDLVYGNTHAGAFFSILGKLTGIPLVFDMHGIPEEFLLVNELKISNVHKFFLMKFMDSAALRFSDKIICVSKTMIGYLHNEKGVPLKKMTYVTNGVDLNFFKPMDKEKINNMKKQLGIENKFVFGYIGYFQEYQGVENFIEVAKKIGDRGTAFLIVGGEKESKENDIIFIPKVPRAQIPDYYSVCDVLVLPRPSHIVTEVAAPTKFAEYTAMGKPILTTDVGDAADFVRQYQNGIIVENNHPENLEKGMLEFLTIDKDELIKMGQNSRKLAENEFDWKKISKNLMKCLEEAVTK
ncbi:glycosyltransferase family 4 protein [Candidatus Parcubacteria bacterium]|nr:glycosyltransferase family 4 protein [Candidatus Parcubacteria bacterium]